MTGERPPPEDGPFRDHGHNDVTARGGEDPVDDLFSQFAEDPADGAPPRRRFGAGAVAGFTVLALVAGGAAGAAGGWFASQPPDTPETSVAVPKQLTSPAPTSPAPELPPPPAHSLQAVAAKLLPAVVQLRYREAGSEISGSGVVISQNGQIITNNHVIAKATETGTQVQAVFHDGTTTPVAIVGRDPTSDIAVVRARGVSGRPTAELGRSDTLRVGQTVIAVGSPYELSGTVTVGIVSALHRAIRAGGEQGGGDTSTVMDAIQTDAAINHGNSGGPLVDTAGRVVGINSAIYSPRGSGKGGISTTGGNVGIGFAIPVDQARRVARQLIKTGAATQTFLGARVTDAGADGGALLVRVKPSGPADRAGLSPGDVIRHAGGRVVGSADDLIAAVHAARPGQELPLSVRGGSTVQVTLGGRQVDVH